MPEKMKKQTPWQRMDEIAQAVKSTGTDKEDLYEREAPKEKNLQLIVFRLTREWYGVEITKVKEVIKVGKITYLPSCPDHIAGIVNLRGYILSVTDLKPILGLVREEPTEKTRIIAIESDYFETGFLVDEVVESIEVPLSKIEPALLTLPAERAKYLRGQCKVDDKLIAIVNVEKVSEKTV
jgi:purine-binding chemotaxis protein CheW